MLLKIVGGFTALVAMAFYSAVAVTLGWSWFVVPFGLPEIGYAHALGISGLMSLLTYHGSPEAKGKKFTDAVIEGYIRITVIIGLMWLYSALM